MLTGGNNYAKQSGGEVVTAYAPDTVIDYLLLKHQPRFDYYARFFKALAAVSDDLMSSRTVPEPQPLPISGGGGSSANKTATVTVGHCTDDDPAHMGSLDASQKWVASGGGSISGGAPFLLENVGTGLCLDPLGATKPPTLVKCTAGSSKMQWSYKGQQFASVATRPCQIPTSEGQQCHVCLDMSGATALDLWDCKPDGGNANQKFVYDKAEQGISTGSGAAKACLTAAAVDGGGAEASVYGGAAFLSNMDDADDVTVTFHGKHYYLQNHSVAIVKIATGEVVFNSSVLTTAESPEAAARTLASPDRRTTEGVRSSEWSVYQETAAAGCAQQRASAKGPIEQLHLTGGGTACSGYYRLVRHFESLKRTHRYHHHHCDYCIYQLLFINC